MTTTVHFIDVGQGNMALVECTNGAKFVVDCNITENNKEKVIKYLADRIGKGSSLTAFICTHRDADHMRGVKILHDNFPLKSIWDNDYPGHQRTRPNIELICNSAGTWVRELSRRTRAKPWVQTRFQYLSAKDSRLA